MRLLATAILLCCCVSNAVAEKIPFTIDLSGTSNLGNTLSVFGTFRVDPALPIDSLNIGPYSLFVQRNAETPVRSLSFLSLAVPNDTLGTMQMAWSLLGNNLYVSRTSPEDSTVTYLGLSFLNPLLPTASFNLGSGAFEHSITYGDMSGIETAVLKGVSGPDGPNGFRVATAVFPVPVPAPSSFMLGLAGMCMIGFFVRRQRQAVQVA